MFYDLGDPFIDANDDGIYDQQYPGGPWEKRFCNNTAGASCATYQGPNGQWDSATTIWVPTWVAFTDNASPHTAAAGVAPQAIPYSPACLPEGGASFADIFVFDEFLNSPPKGTSYGAPMLDSAASPSALLTFVPHGFFTEGDNWGAMGKFGFDFDYFPVLPSGAACVVPATPTAPTACVFRLLFRDFDGGYRGTIEADNNFKTGGTCAGTPPTFKSSIGVNNIRGVIYRGQQSGQYAP